MANVPELCDSTDHGIFDNIKIQADRTPDAIAIAAPGRLSLTYKDLHSHLGGVTKRLNELGIRRNDRVAIVLPNGPEMALAFLSVSACATSVPLNPGYREREFEFYLSDLNPCGLIIQSGMESPARVVAEAHGIPIIELSPQLEAEAGIFSLAGETHPSPSPGGFAQPEDVALVLHTSGTTSQPKKVPLTQKNICNSAFNIRSTLGLTEGDRCLNLMPLFHIHGLIGAVVSSIISGATVVCTPGFSISEFFGWLEKLRPTWYTAVPTIHQAILENASSHIEIIRDARLRFIRSSSASLAPQLMSELEGIFSVPVIESYGMTEASHQVASNPLPPGVRKTGSVGKSAGPEVAIMNEKGKLALKGATGEIVIRGPNILSGYENNTAANESSFTDGWFRTGDQGYLDDENYLFITGRLKEIINRGGQKVSPREVDEALMGHPAVAQVVTFGVSHPKLGEDIAAAVVLKKGEAATEKEIRELAFSQLAGYKVPSQVLIVEEIPKGPTGKLQRIGLAEKIAPAMSADFRGSRNETEDAIVRIWSKMLRRGTIGVYDNFFALGGDSLLAAEVVSGLNEAFNVELPLVTIFRDPILADLASTVEKAVLRREGVTACSSSLVQLKQGGSKPPFFWMAPCNDHIVCYLPLAHHSRNDQSIYGLVPIDTNGERLPFSRIEEMAERYIEEIRSLQPQGPYFLGGLSGGGLIAFEVAQQLLRQGEQVAFLAMFDTHGREYPQFPPHLSKFALALNRIFDRIHLHVNNLSSLDTKATLNYIGKICKGKLFGSILNPNEASSRIAEATHYVMKANRQAIKNYEFRPYSGKVTLFRASKQPIGCNPDPRLGWGRVVAGELEVHEVPGNHTTLNQEPNVRVFAEKLRACLEKAQIMEKNRITIVSK